MNQIPYLYVNKQHSCLNCISKSRCLNSYLDPEQIKKLYNLNIQKITLKKGEKLFRDGDKLKSIYNIRAGILKTEISHADGKHQVIKFNLPGELTGLDGLEDGHHHTEVTALMTSEICCFNYEQLLRASQMYPSLSENLDRLMSSLLNEIQEHVFLLGGLNSIEKLSSFLLEFSNKMKMYGFSNQHFNLPMNREELASYLGITIETLSRSLTHLNKINILETSNKKIRILKMDELESIYINS